MDKKVEDTDDKTVEQMLLDLENATANNQSSTEITAEKDELSSEKLSTSHLESQVTHFIDSDDAEEIISEPRTPPMPYPEHLMCDQQSPSNDGNDSHSSHCTIEMNDMPINDSSCLENYDTSRKTLFTDEDFGKEQFNKIEVLPGSRFSAEFFKDSTNSSEEAKKNLKKKIKARAEVVENPEAYHPSDFDTNYRKYGTASETRSLLSGDSNNNAQNYSNPRSTKLLKKSAKRLQAAAEAKRLSPEEKADMSKAVNRQQVEQKKVKIFGAC